MLTSRKLLCLRRPRVGRCINRRVCLTHARYNYFTFTSLRLGPCCVGHFWCPVPFPKIKQQRWGHEPSIFQTVPLTALRVPSPPIKRCTLDALPLVQNPHPHSTHPTTATFTRNNNPRKTSNFVPQTRGPHSSVRPTSQSGTRACTCGRSESRLFRSLVFYGWGSKQGTRRASASTNLFSYGLVWYS